MRGIVSIVSEHVKNETVNINNECHQRLLSECKQS